MAAARKALSTYFVRVSSLSDLARTVSPFTGGIFPLYSSERSKGVFTLMSPGAKVGETSMMFYYDVKRKDDFLLYQPETSSTPERLEFGPAPVYGGADLHNIPVIPFAGNPFREKRMKAGGLGVACVRILDYAAIMRPLIAKAAENNALARVYCFTHKGTRYIGSFTIFEHFERKVFSYAEIDTGENFAFFRYDYSANKVEPTNRFGEHSYMYAKVVNLSEPFLFFKPE